MRPLCLFFLPLFEAPLKGNCIFYEAGLLRCFPLVEGKRIAAIDIQTDRHTQTGRNIYQYKSITNHETIYHGVECKISFVVLVPPVLSLTTTTTTTMVTTN